MNLWIYCLGELLVVLLVGLLPLPRLLVLLIALSCYIIEGMRNQGKEQRKREGEVDKDEKHNQLTTASDPNQASRKRKPGQDASHFKTDKSGKLIIDEPSPSTSTNKETLPEGERGDAYLAQQMQVGGAVRDAKGNLKFNKNTKRGREVEKEYEDTYSGGVLEKQEVVKKKKREVTKLGEEFRSKVSLPSSSLRLSLSPPWPYLSPPVCDSLACRPLYHQVPESFLPFRLTLLRTNTGYRKNHTNNQRGKGDIKKNNGPDPYSYVPIDQAAKGKKGQQSRMSMTNKKKGSKA